ncbi:MAG: cytochrome c3 family protein [Chloroflexi bacterium]|uniref:cytochrome c3 family protein n=1 Tax=Candidatus Flexifilum breve TaxID=3140694 RepID=UPI003134DBE3|nr:cytochrome c3 family protein [Chloroflexota bacterium]
MTIKIKVLLILGFWLIAGGLGLLRFGAQIAVAQEATPEVTEVPVLIEATAEAATEISAEATAEAPVDEASDAYCLLCHSKPDQVWTLPSGETLSVTIDPAVLHASVHGASSAEGALGCNDCHPSFRYPHEPSTIRTVRDFQLERYAVCRNCHEDQYTRAQDSVHGEYIRANRVEAAVCVDCHGGHDVQPPNEPRQRISLTCGRCHGVIFEEYSQSVHGQALLGEDNPDVPTCIDCHGVHDIANPTTALFRTRSPELCAQCHADASIMDQYDISTEVFDSYLTDFHGSTVALFEQETEGAVTNKAVCYDCHGVHSIQPIGDGTAIRETLVTTCRTCHPDASADFSNAWLGHYPATPEHQPALYTAGIAYDVALPIAAIIPLLLLVTEVFRRLRSRGK